MATDDNAARCFARSRRTSTAGSPTPNCSSTSSSFLRSRRSRTRCSRHFTPLGALQVTLLFLAVWWVWVYTSWITNWLNPEKTPVRLLLFALTLGGLVLSTSIPTGVRSARDYGSRWPMPRCRSARPCSCGCRRRRHGRGADECDPHHGMAGVVGGVLDRRRICEGQSRLVLWAIALAIEYFSPAVRFWIPEYGASWSPIGWSRAATWPNAAPCSSSSRSANPSS